MENENEINFTLPQVYQQWVQFEFYKYVFHFIYGGRASGKSFTTAFLLLSYGCTQRVKIFCLREFYNSIDESVHSMLSTLIERYKFPYIVKDQYIYNPMTGSMFIFDGLHRNLEKIKSMNGINVAWIEQAEAVSKKSLEILIPTIIRNKNPKIIFTINPEEEGDPIWTDFMLQRRKDTYYLQSSYKDNPFCTPELLAEINRLKETSYADYLHIYEGEFRVQGDDILISTIKYNQAVDRIVNIDGAFEYGVDCARYGKDSSSITKRKGFNHIFTKEFNQKSTTELARIVMRETNQDKNAVIKIDIGGLGAGTFDTLKDHGYNVKEVNFGGNSAMPDNYANTASEMWCEFNKIIDQVHIEPTDRLKKELTTRKYKVDRKGRYLIEPKDEYKKRGYASPDHADSFLLAFLEIKTNDYFGFV